MSRYGSSTGKYMRESKPTFIIKPRRCFADEGTSGKFKASYDGEPMPGIEWVRKGVPIESSDKFRIYKEKDFHFLEITDVTKEDRGQYTCVISNHMGTTRVTAELEVYPSRNKPKKLEPVSLSNLKAASRSSEKLTRSTERLADSSTGEALRTSRKFAKSSENLTSGMTFSAAPSVDTRQKTTSRLTVQTNSRADRSPRRGPTSPKSPKSPNTQRSGKSRISTRRQESEGGTVVTETVKTQEIKTITRNNFDGGDDEHIESNNNMVKEDERPQRSSQRESMDYIESTEESQREAVKSQREAARAQREAARAQSEADMEENEAPPSRNEARVTSTKTVNIRNTRHIEVENDSTDRQAPPPQKNTSTLQINIGGNNRQSKSDREIKVSSVRNKFESTGSTESTHSTKINVAPSSSAKLSSVRNKFEAGVVDIKHNEKPKHTYGGLDVKKAGIRSGKLASLSRRFAEMEDTGPILPKPPPQPGTTYSKARTGAHPGTTAIRIDPRNNGSHVSRAEPKMTAATKSRDIPEISISSDVEFKVQVSRQAEVDEDRLPEPEPEIEEAETPPTPPSEDDEEPDEEYVLQAPVSSARNITPPKTMDKTKSLDIPKKKKVPTATLR